MKKIIIGGLVGGLLMFIWQFVSWTAIHLHQPVTGYTPKQDTILSYLSSNLSEGGYLLPTVPEGSSSEEEYKRSEQQQGKPWANIQYHASYDGSSGKMIMNILKSFLSSVIMVWMFCWILSKWSQRSFGGIFIASLFTGLIVFINAPYSLHIWYQTFDVKASLIDALASWGLCGIWLGWWMKRK